MAQRNDDELAFYLTQAVKASGQISDEDSAYLLAQLSIPQPYNGASQINDLWRSFWVSVGIPNGDYAGMAYAWLVSQGIPAGSISDMWHDYFEKPFVNKELTKNLIDRSSNTIISFSRVSTLSVVDHEGKTVTTLPEESGFTGARRVENLFTETEDLSGAPWGLTLNGGATAVFSTDNSMVTLTCFSGGDRAYLTYGFTTLAGIEYRASFLQTILSGNVTGGSFVLTGGQDQTGLVTVDASGKAQSAIISDAIGASGSMRMGIGVSSGSTLPASIQLSLPQLEDVTGNLDNNASEFVSSVDHGANVNGVQWFDTALGSNVLLTTLRGMLNTSSTLVTYPSLTPPILNDFKVEVSVTADQAMGTVHIISAYIDSNNYTSILHNGVNIIARKRISGVNNDANFALPTLVVGTTYNIMATFSSVNGIDITVNGSAGSNNPNTADTAAATNNFIGSANGANEFLGSIKNIFIG